MLAPTGQSAATVSPRTRRLSPSTTSLRPTVLTRVDQSPEAEISAGSVRRDCRQRRAGSIRPSETQHPVDEGLLEAAMRRGPPIKSGQAIPRDLAVALIACFPKAITNHDVDSPTSPAFVRLPGSGESSNGEASRSTSAPTLGVANGESPSSDGAGGASCNPSHPRLNQSVEAAAVAAVSNCLAQRQDRAMLSCLAGAPFTWRRLIESSEAWRHFYLSCLTRSRSGEAALGQVNWENVITLVLALKMAEYDLLEVQNRIFEVRQIH
ncbi:unnamed protein product [Protopolystoma xenopodis]|uniref:Uncharacterized protein n=1 Tax=Protopolystoma xenopodis TaxID=117903 RepID=A0A448WWN0_9PLAT|nr:unnamed protein product [Protopolystoma xenopodis]